MDYYPSVMSLVWASNGLTINVQEGDNEFGFCLAWHKQYG